MKKVVVNSITIRTCFVSGSGYWMITERSFGNSLSSLNVAKGISELLIMWASFQCVWKHICKLWEDFKNHIRLKVGNGRKIHFWVQQMNWYRDWRINFQLSQFSWLGCSWKLEFTGSWQSHQELSRWWSLVLSYGVYGQ